MPDLPDTSGNGLADGKVIAVIVRWRHNDAWRELVLLTAKKNPASF